MQNDSTREHAAQDEVQPAAQSDSAEPANDELGDEALENVAGGWWSDGGDQLPPWVVPTVPDGH